MKSIIEEASSIAKAVEAGWLRAGKPQEFTVRIFEEPEKNFLGFSKKFAKVGIMYKEAPEVQQSGKQRGVRRQELPERQERQENPRQVVHQQAEKGRAQVAPKTEPLKGAQRTVSQPELDRERPPKWAPEIVEASREWLLRLLETMGKSSTPFTVEGKGYTLHVHFKGNIVPDKKKEYVFFKHTGHLLVQAMRHKFRRGLHGCRVAVTTAE